MGALIALWQSTHALVSFDISGRPQAWACAIAPKLHDQKNMAIAASPCLGGNVRVRCMAILLPLCGTNRQNVCFSSKVQRPTEVDPHAGAAAPLCSVAGRTAARISWMTG
jgi:hypothetical protein